MTQKYNLAILKIIGLSFCLLFALSPSALAQDKAMGKTSAPVKVELDLPRDNMPGQTAELGIRVIPLRDVSSMKLKIIGNPDVIVVGQNGQFDFGPQQKGVQLSETVTIIPAKAGTSLLDMFVSVTFNNRTMTRAITIPIRAGSGNERMSINKRGSASKTGATTDAQGNKVIVMPAIEAPPVADTRP